MNELNNKIFDNINGFSLDNEQRKAILTKSKYSIIIAGAGSGKTLTMLGKIKYLTLIKKINHHKILYISFTNETTKSLKSKLNNPNINILTFHKLAINILKLNNMEYELADDNFLDIVITDFFENYCFYNSFLKKQFKKLQHKLILTSKKYFKIINDSQFNKTKSIIKTFIKLYNTNDLTKNEFQTFFNFQNQSILFIIYSIINLYEKEKWKNNLLDFDDLIKEATKLIINNKKVPNYQEIIVDEFQDTSYLRLKLIKALTLKNNANLTVVGDDFQSIYKFSGCDLDLFLNFSKHFPGAMTYKIQNTYRNSQELINIAGNFIMKNKNQIHKNLKSFKHLDKPIKLIKEKNKKTTLLKTINYIINNYGNDILILGRNNNDIYHYFAKDDIKWLDNNYFVYKNLTLRYLTVHKSKGLESNNVIIINLENNTFGFPNQLKDDIIIKLIKKEENFFLAEERRLFYVALTRTKNYCFLLVPKNVSAFVTEIAKDKENTEYLKID